MIRRYGNKLVNLTKVSRVALETDSSKEHVIEFNCESTSGRYIGIPIFGIGDIRSEIQVKFDSKEEAEKELNEIQRIMETYYRNILPKKL